MKKIVLFSILFNYSAFAQWVQTNGPYGGDVTCFAVSNENLFAGTGNGVFRTTNNGISRIRTSLDSSFVGSIAVSGTNVIGATSSGIYVSSNNGVSWAKTSTINNVHGRFAVSGLNIFAGTDDGVFMSTDFGITWTQTTLDSGYIVAIAASGTQIIAATPYGAFLSTDNAISWRFVTTCWGGGTSGYTIPLCMEFLGGTIFVSLLEEEGPPFNYVYSGGVFRSTDFSNTWAESIPGGRFSPFINCFAGTGTNLFAGTEGVVFLSTNNGIRWNTIDTGLINYNVLALAVSGTDLFAGTVGGGVWKRPLSEMITHVHADGGSTALPIRFILEQNYPNPFNPSTAIRFAIPNNTKVTLTIYDLLGREIETLVNEDQSAGWKEVKWDAKNISSGMYFYALTAGTLKEIKKMMLIR